MSTRTAVCALVAFLILPLTLALRAGAQQITTGVIQGSVSDSTGASLPGVTVEARQSRHQPGPHSGDRSRRPLRVPATAARELPRELHDRGIRDDGAGERAPDGWPIDQHAGGDEGVRRGRNRDGHDRDAGDRHRAHRVRDDDQPGDDRDDPDSRTQVRGPADAHARRQRRPGPRRRRDLVCRPARRLQQHQPRRRRLQQRVLRRAGRRTARVDRHHARCHQGVPGDRQRRACRIRPHGRWRRQRHHQVGHELDEGKRLLLPAPRGTHRRPL